MIHEPMRFALASALASGGPMSFAELRRALGATDGNLAAHARRLEAAGYVSCEKAFAGRIPRTSYRLTAAGRRALAAYTKQMRKLIPG